ncbi:MAG: polysaccharide deacetylase family protein [Bacteroidetes bacterium]|nr:MAG: polysaccharide deacetylase family protein [Bacteroidota bacterium]
MYFVKTPKIFQLFFKNYIWQIPGHKKSIYLTFDDGPHKETTPLVLNILEKYNAKATFFVLGKNAIKHPELIEGIRSRGHGIGNHGYSHKNGWGQGEEEFIQDVEKCNKILNTALFRPPFGKLTKKQTAKLKEKYKLVFWTVMPGDFDTAITKQRCLARSIKNTHKGTIIVFHENEKAKENMLYTLPLFLKHFSGKGFVFKPIPQL